MSAVPGNKLLALGLCLLCAGTGAFILHEVFWRPAGITGGDLGFDPPLLGVVPDFALTERSGRPVARADLLGKVWLVDFIFTRCTGPCPMMTQRMGELQARLQDTPHWPNVRLVTISVDPEYDTPAVLSQYAQRAGAGEQWHFLTGSRRAIWQLCRDGFKLPVGEDGAATHPAQAGLPIFHSQKFVLVDRYGRIRGYYGGLAEEDRDKLARDLERVVREK